MDDETLVGLVEEHLPADEAQWLLSQRRPAVSIEHSPAADVRSRLGGPALLPPGTAWPTWNDKPLSLVALLDLAELAGMDTGLDLPTLGLLNVFFEADEQTAWGFDPAHADGSRLVLADPSDAVIVEPPSGAVHFATFPVAGRQYGSIPSLDEERLPTHLIDGTQEYTWELEEALDEAGPHHQIGGWPRHVQGSFWLECQLASSGIYCGGESPQVDSATLAQHRIEAQEWELLLQLDCDFVAGQEWGDMGRLYFVMRRSDIAEGRFDRSWMVLQCS